MGTAFSYFAPNSQADFEEKPKLIQREVVERYKELVRQGGLNLSDIDLLTHLLNLLSEPSNLQFKSNFCTAASEAVLRHKTTKHTIVPAPARTSQRLEDPTEKATCFATPDYKAIAISNPQWRWTHDECVSWIKACLVHYGGYRELEATSFASQFHGYGPSLLITSMDEWFGWLHNDGISIGYHLHDTRHNEGGLPKTKKWIEDECKEDRERSAVRGREKREKAFETLGWKLEDNRPKLKIPIESCPKNSTKEGENDKNFQRHEHKRKKETQSDLKHSTKEGGHSDTSESYAQKFEEEIQSSLKVSTTRETQGGKGSEYENHEQKIKTTPSESNYNKNKKMWDAYSPELPKIAFRMLAQEYRKNPKQGSEKQVQPDSNSKDRNVLEDSNDANDSKDKNGSKDARGLNGSNNSNNSQDWKDLSDDSKDSDWEGNWEVDA